MKIVALSFIGAKGPEYMYVLGHDGVTVAIHKEEVDGSAGKFLAYKVIFEDEYTVIPAHMVMAHYAEQNLPIVEQAPFMQQPDSINGLTPEEIIEDVVPQLDDK